MFEGYYSAIKELGVAMVPGALGVSSYRTSRQQGRNVMPSIAKAFGLEATRIASIASPVPLYIPLTALIAKAERRKAITPPSQTHINDVVLDVERKTV